MDPVSQLAEQLRRMGAPDHVIEAVEEHSTLEGATQAAIDAGVAPDVIHGIVFGTTAVDEDGVATTQSPLPSRGPVRSPLGPINFGASASDISLPDQAMLGSAAGGLDPMIAAFIESQPEDQQPFIGLEGFGQPNPAGVVRAPDPVLAEVPVRGLPGVDRNVIPNVVAPQYRHGDEHDMFVGAAPEAIAGFQVQMVEAGLLKMGDFAPGYWDVPSMGAMQQVLGYSNNTGRTFEESLQFLAEVYQARLAADPGAAEHGTQLPQGRTFLLPDMAEINQKVKSEFRRQLGREPSAAELATFAAQFMADSRAAIAQQMEPFTDDQGNLIKSNEELLYDEIGRTRLTPEDRSRLIHSAKQRQRDATTHSVDDRPLLEGSGIGPERNPEFGVARSDAPPLEDVDAMIRERRGRQLLEYLGIDPEDGSPDDDPSPFDEDREREGDRVLQGINPAARFLEAFDKAFAGEIARNERVQETSARRAMLMRSLLGLKEMHG